MNHGLFEQNPTVDHHFSPLKRQLQKHANIQYHDIPLLCSHDIPIISPWWWLLCTPKISATTPSGAAKFIENQCWNALQQSKGLILGLGHMRWLNQQKLLGLTAKNMGLPFLPNYYRSSMIQRFLSGAARLKQRVSPRGWSLVDPRLQCLQRENRKLADDFEKTKGKAWMALDDAGCWRSDMGRPSQVKILPDESLCWNRS